MPDLAQAEPTVTSTSTCRAARVSLGQHVLIVPFDPAHPEVLYAPVPGEQRLQLVGVEYLVPVALSATPGFWHGG
jgi:hypothetical protein